MGFCVDHVVTRSVRDSAAMLDVTGQPEPGSPYAIPAKAGPYLDEVGREPRRLRIVWSTETPSGRPPSDEVTSAMHATAAMLSGLGHDVVEGGLGVDYKALYAARAPVSGANFAAGMARTIELVGREPGPDDLEAMTWASLNASRKVSGEQAFRGYQQLRMLTRSVLERFETIDVYLSPVMTAPAPAIGDIAGASVDPATIMRRQTALFPYAALFNFTGQPSISLPLAAAPSGLPIGMMFTARYADEATLFRLASQLEREIGWAGGRPAIWN